MSVFFFEHNKIYPIKLLCVTMKINGSSYYRYLKNRIFHRQTGDMREQIEIKALYNERWTLEGWVYIAAVLNLFSRRIVGWVLAKHMHEELIREALSMAISTRYPTRGLTHHSDRGSQYASLAYQELLRKHHITVSMSRKGNYWDNAVLEKSNNINAASLQRSTSLCWSFV